MQRETLIFAETALTREFMRAVSGIYHVCMAIDEPGRYPFATYIMHHIRRDTCCRTDIGNFTIGNASGCIFHNTKPTARHGGEVGINE